MTRHATRAPKAAPECCQALAFGALVVVIVEVSLLLASLGSYYYNIEPPHLRLPTRQYLQRFPKMNCTNLIQHELDQ